MWPLYIVGFFLYSLALLAKLYLAPKNFNEPNHSCSGTSIFNVSANSNKICLINSLSIFGLNGKGLEVINSV